MSFLAQAGFDSAASSASAAIRSVHRNLLLLGAVAVLGTLLAAGAGLLATSFTYHALQDAAHAAGALRLHEDVDMLHDEIRADVATAAAGLPLPADFEAHARELEDKIHQLERLALPEDIAGAIHGEARELRDYIGAARDAMAHPDAIKRAEVIAFTEHWRRLEPGLESTTDRLRELVSEAEERGRSTYAGVVALLLVSFIVIALGLAHAARRISKAVIATNEQLVAATQGARRASQSRADFLAAMSHEIRTPMTGVLGIVDLLASEDLPARSKGYVESLRASGRHLLNVINDILDFTRIESGKLELEHIDFSLPDVMERLRSLVHPLAVDRGLALQFHLPPGPVVLRGDPTRLQQVMLNLATNAVKFTDRGSVSVRVARQAHLGPGLRYRFEVRDTGVGIPPERMASLFAAFQQADESIARRYGGSGLGLAICKRLVDAMGGTIGVESQPGTGSTFFFDLPFAPGDVGQLAIHSEGRQAALAPRRILVAEDVEINREILRGTLEKAGHTVVFASHGAEAVALAQQQRFDLILMDVQMPGMDGVEATRRIRKQPGPNRATPILALTANVMAQERERYLAAGMDEFLGKPIDWDQLFAAIARHSRASASAPVAASGAAPEAGASLIDAAVLGALEEMAGHEQVGEWMRVAFAGYTAGLRAMGDGHDIRAAATQAHKIKGSAGTLGLARLRASAQALEAAADAGVALEALLSALRQAVADSGSELRSRGLL